jgi:hypothetical protein
MTKTIKTFFTLIFLVVVLIIPYFVFAQAPLDALKKAATDSGYEVTDKEQFDLPTYIGGIISIFMGLLGMIFIVLMIYGGFNWMRAAGDESKVKLAIDTIRRAVIGLLIVVGSYAIGSFILFKLMY